MRAGGSKAKGNAQENRVAKELSLWLTANEYQDVLERSPSSGAKFTIHRKKDRNVTNIVGDLIAVNASGQPLVDKFVIEIKHQNELNLNVANLFYQTATDGLLGYWQKLLGECDQTGKLPMLIFRQNNRPMMVMLCQKGIELFDCKKIAHCVVRVNSQLIYISTFDAFKEFADPEKLKIKPVVTKSVIQFQV